MAVSDPFRGTPFSNRGTRMRGTKAVIETLKAHGTEYLFGVPGSTFVLFAEFAGRDDVKAILTRDERAAACMADGYSRISHKPGVCTGCEGPGTVNLMNGIGEAWMSSGVLTTLLTAALTRATISLGMAFGASKPKNEMRLNPGNAASLVEGMDGNNEWRFSLPPASARYLPARSRGSVAGALAIFMSTWPLTTATTESPAPL